MTKLNSPIIRVTSLLAFLFSIIGIGTINAQPPPPPYTHYQIINADVSGEREVGKPVTIIVTIQDTGNIQSSTGTYEIYINRTPVDYQQLYLGAGDSTTIRYTHYFDSPGTYSIDIVTCSELGSCPDDIASGTISIKDSSTPPLPPMPPPPSNQPPWATITAPSEVEVGETFWVKIIDYGDDQPNPLMFEYDFGDGERVRSPGAEPHSYSQPGIYTIRGRVCDPQGACSNTNSVTVRAVSSQPTPPLPPPPPSNLPPSVTLSCYPLSLTPNDTLSCEANASDPNDDPLSYEWFLNGQKLTNISSSSNRVYWDKPQPGSYTLKVVVYDNRGGTAQSSVSFTVQETRQNKPPVIQSIEYDPSSPLAGQLVRFWANVYDDNGWIVAYEWDFGSRHFQAEEQAEYAWQNPGTYRVCLTVYDNDGDSTRKCRDITVREAKTLLPPRANFTVSNTNPKVGETVYFKDQSTDPDGRIVIRGWFVNEQFFSEDPNPARAFSAPGTYTVCLEVADNDYQTDAKCTTITVRSEEKPQQPPVARLTITAPTGQTIQEHGELRLTVNRGQTISFNFSASNSYDPDGGGIRTYEWRINGTLVSQQPEFSYALTTNAPKHEIYLKITDDEGQTAEVGARIIITEQQAPVNPTLRVEGSTSSTKQQGQTFNLSGSGYTPNGSVSIFVVKDGKLIDVFQKQADRNGNISWPWPTSCNTATGTYEVQAIDDATNTPSNSITETVTANSTCGSSPVVAPKLWVDNRESSERKQGETFVLTGSGFTPGGEVEIWVGPPDIPGYLPRVVTEPVDTKIADPNGNLNWTWTPQCTDLGQYQVWAVDVKTGKRSNEGKPVTERVLPNPAKCSNVKVPIIFIPGIKGTELYMGDKRLWPDVACIEWLPWQLDEDDLKLDSGKIITPGEVIRDLDQYTQPVIGQLHLKKCRDNLGLITFQGYKDFLDALEQAGYREDQTLFLFPYDWRKDLRDVAKDLKDRIDEVLEQTGSQQVDIIAHSMGGLVVRYYLNKLEPNSTKVRKLVLAGTPNHGAPQAFKGLVWGDTDGIMLRLAFSRAASKRLSQTFPSAYQLLPTRKFLELYNYIVSLNLQPVDGQSDADRALRDTYSIIKFTSSHPDLVENATRFHSEVGEFLKFSGETYIIAGTGQTTPIFYVCRNAKKPNDCLQEEPQVVTMNLGDGTVPLVSALELVVGPGRMKKMCVVADHLEVLVAATESIKKFLSGDESVPSDNCPSYYEPIGGIDRGDVAPVPPPTTKTIEQAIASLVPNDPPGVANPDVIIGEQEIMEALRYYQENLEVPSTGGQKIDQAMLQRLMYLWDEGIPVNTSPSAATFDAQFSAIGSLSLLTRQLDRRSLEFIALGSDVESLQVEIFNLQGQKVFAEETTSNRLIFRGQDSQGRRLASGVYLYIVTVRNYDGTIKRSEVRKLVLRR